MRVISGSRRGAKLNTLKGDQVRPTTDRVKENIFNLIQFDILDKRILDLFAGSGAMGIEAISRGAKEGYFIEADIKAYEVVKKNIKMLDFLNKAKLYHKSFEAFLESTSEKFDLVFLDPPYHKKMIDKALYLLRKNRLLSEDAKLVLECDYDETIDITGFSFMKEKLYGRVKITILKFNSHHMEEI